MSLKRQRDPEGSILLNNNAEEEEKTPSKKSKKVPQQKATVIKVAATQPTAVPCSADKHIIERIRKCLELANHPTAAEAEAEAAMFLAKRLMSKHDVATADLLAKGTKEHRAKLAGSSEVSIRSTKGDGHRVVHQGFVSTLASSMVLFFNCKCYSTRRAIGIDWTFYGIAENTAAGAQAFEMTHNKIVDWACAHSGASASFSYCQGVADGLWYMASDQKKQETKNAQKQEEKTLAARKLAENLQREKEIERLKGPCEDMKVESSPQTYPEDKHRDGLLLPHNPIHVESSNGSTDDISVYGDSIDGHDDNDENEGLDSQIEPDFKLDSVELLEDAAKLDEEVEKVLRRQPSLSNYTNAHTRSPKVANPDTRHPTHANSVSCWASEMQLVRFRELAEQVADEYLKAANMKLGKNRAKKATVKDREAYRQGKEDSKKVDVHQKLVE